MPTNQSAFFMAQRFGSLPHRKNHVNERHLAATLTLAAAYGAR